MTTHPFDAAAPTYDADFTQHPLGVWLRALVREYVPFQAGQHVLELGCGTGEDALWLAGHGVRVLATDAAPAMLAITSRKAAGLPVETHHYDMNADAAAPTPPDAAYDGVFSNFGAVNCVEDRARLARQLADCVKPGGAVVLVVMGRWCAWEIGWHMTHLQPGVALRRLRRAGQAAHVGDGQTVTVWYISPGELKREFAPYFQHERTVGIGALLPPSYLAHLVERHPRTFARLARWDARYGVHLPGLSDHYLMRLRRV